MKTVVAGSSEAQSQIMITEGTSLHGIVQQHVQRILAATWDGTSPMLVYPYAKHGNLKRWLLASGQAAVSTHVVVSLGLQMLKGGDFLNLGGYLLQNLLYTYMIRVVSARGALLAKN